MKFKLLALAAASLVASAASATTYTLDFDTDALGNTIAGNTSITEQYAAWGVHFRGIEDGNTVNVNAAPDADGHAVPSAPNAMSNCANASSTCPGNRADIVRITFDGPVHASSVLLDTLGSNTVTFQMFDALNNLIGTASGTSMTFGLVTLNTDNVSRIDVLQPSDSWAYNFDNLQFDAVPEPGMLGLFGLGAIGLGLSRRRRA